MRWPRIPVSLLGLLVAMLVIAFAISYATQPWAATVGLAIVLQFVAFWVCIEALAKNVPRSIDRLQHSNCIRQDGTWSKRRAKVEEKSRDRLRREVAKTFLLVAIASNVAGWFVHREVIPIPVAVEALSSFRWNEAAWKKRLGDDERRLDGWLTGSARLSPSQALARKRLLWRSWPLALAGAAVWTAGCCWFIASSYHHALKELRASAQFRADQHRLRALHESVGNDDFAKVSRQRSSDQKKHLSRPRLTNDTR